MNSKGLVYTHKCTSKNKGRKKKVLFGFTLEFFLVEATFLIFSCPAHFLYLKKNKNKLIGISLDTIVTSKSGNTPIITCYVKRFWNFKILNIL